MKKLLFIIPLLLSSMFANAGEFGDRALAPTCNAMSRTCTSAIQLAIGKPVSWSFTAQTSGTPGLRITYIDDQGNVQTIVNTSVSSPDLNSRATGQFNPPVTGAYTVIFSNVTDMREDTAAILNNLGVAVVTYQFATDDGGVQDFNDGFASITSFDQKG